jgi:hypothetical protein
LRSALSDGGEIYRVDFNIENDLGVTATIVANNTPNHCGGTTAVPGCVP